MILVCIQQQGQSIGQTWKKSSVEKSLQQAVKQFDSPGNLLRNITQDGRGQLNIDPLEIPKRALYATENIFAFSEAASYKIYKRTQKNLGLSSTNAINSDFG